MPVSVQPPQLGTKITAGSWPVDRKVDLVLQGLRGQRPVTDLCREAGVSPVRFGQWCDEFIDAGRAGLTCAEIDCQNLQDRVKQLEAENVTLRRQLKILQELCLAE